jgi:hypothetical protein
MGVEVGRKSRKMGTIPYPLLFLPSPIETRRTLFMGGGLPPKPPTFAHQIFEIEFDKKLLLSYDLI